MRSVSRRNALSAATMRPRSARGMPSSIACGSTLRCRMSERVTRIRYSNHTVDVLLVTAVATLCAFLFIGSKSLSFDEGITLWFVRLDWLYLWNSLHQLDGGLAPYYAILHIWTTAF